MGNQVQVPPPSRPREPTHRWRQLSRTRRLTTFFALLLLVISFALYILNARGIIQGSWISNVSVIFSALAVVGVVLPWLFPLVDDGRKEINKGGEVRAEGVRELAKEADTNTSTQRLRVFLCHSSGDKPQVRGVYKRLTAEGIEAWLDEESLLPGQDWELEISRAIRSTHVVIVCLSKNSTTKRGYVQKEIKFALDEADKQPEGTIFIIPVKVEECDLPDRLRRYHTVNLFEERGFEKLMRALRSRADELGLTLTSI